MEQVFKNILDDDEVIIKTFKPNKLKFYFTVFVSLFFISIFLYLPLMMALFFDGETPQQMHYLLPLFGALSFVLLVIIVILFARLSYKKRLYAYTNKRILIQGGIIGVDYKGLDHKMIGATEVKVGVLDKLLRQNTGMLRFGSQASPLNQQGVSMFIFAGITNPYDVYREIKKYIDSVK